MAENYSFGYWVLRRRKALDLTREELAIRVGCASETIKKIERDERRPSRQIAALLANALAVPREEHTLFLQVARGERSAGRLHGVIEHPIVLPTLRHNLPIQLTSFIGRQDEIVDLKSRLEDQEVRLYTILGPGGIGKTRFGLQVAYELLDTFPGGIWLVELASLSDPALLPGEILTILGIPEQPNREISNGLVDFLKSRPRILLVLDNCEHLQEACADMSSLLLKNCANLQILATSRQALAISGEAIWPVPGLSLPEMPEATSSTKHDVLDPGSVLERSEAIRLFVERACLVQPHFKLTTHNLSTVAQICRSLDGMPLAIELAAARLKVMSVEEIATRLDERFQLLHSTTRHLEQRHQTLHGVVDWSYNLLHAPERLVFKRLSIFRGGFTLDAAEAVSGELIEGSTMLDVLSSLVEKSMVVVETASFGTRYRLLETLRLYGEERLVESDEAEIMRQRHAAYFARFAEYVDPQLRGPQQVEWLEALARDHDNLRGALEWTAKNDMVTGLRLASALWWFWIVRSYFSEGREWLERLITAKETSSLDQINVKAYARYVYLMSYLLDNAQLYEIAEEGLKRARQIEDPDSMAIALLMMAGDPYYAGDEQKSRSLLEESLSLFHESGNRWGIATVLRALAALSEVRLRDHTHARKLALETIALARDLGDLRAVSNGLFLMGEIERHLGHWDSAASYYQECFSSRSELNDRLGMAIILWKLAVLSEHQNDYTRAVELREATMHILHEIHHQEMTANILGQLAYLVALAGDNTRALELSQQSLNIAREIKTQRPLLDTFLALGEVALSQGEATTALQYFREALAIGRDHSLPQGNVIYVLEALARLAIFQNQVERAVQLLGAAEALRKRIKLILYPRNHDNWEDTLNHAHAHLDEETFTVAWDQGCSLAKEGWEHIIDYAMSEEKK